MLCAARQTRAPPSCFISIHALDLSIYQEPASEDEKSYEVAVFCAICAAYRPRRNTEKNGGLRFVSSLLCCVFVLCSLFVGRLSSPYL